MVVVQSSTSSDNISGESIHSNTARLQQYCSAVVWASKGVIEDKHHVQPKRSLVECRMPANPIGVPIRTTDVQNSCVRITTYYGTRSCVDRS